MNSSGGAFFALFLFLQLVTAVAVLLGGIYALYCLHRMNENINRLADVAEAWIVRQEQVSNVPQMPLPVVGRVEHVVAPPVAQPAAVPVPSTPQNPPIVDNESKF